MSNNQPWPLREATALLAHVEALEARGLRDPADPVLFETGYGPSGLPHIGTFAEVARTTFIRRAFRQISDRPTTLVAFSDDMDGLRKVPLNIPDPERVTPHLGKPLSSIPDPFGEDASYSAHMNRRLREFLDRFGFAYSARRPTSTGRACSTSRSRCCSARSTTCSPSSCPRCARSPGRAGPRSCRCARPAAGT